MKNWILFCRKKQFWSVSRIFKIFLSKIPCKIKQTVSFNNKDDGRKKISREEEERKILSHVFGVFCIKSDRKFFAILGLILKDARQIQKNCDISISSLFSREIVFASRLSLKRWNFAEFNFAKWPIHGQKP